MLNYVWAGLIILSFVFGIAYDVRDLSNDTYRNGADYQITLSSDEPFDTDARRKTVTVHVDPVYFQSFYGVTEQPDSLFSGVLIQTEEGSQLRFAKDAAVPEPWATIRSETSDRDNDMRGTIANLGFSSPTTASASFRFKDVRFVKMHAIAQAAISMAETAVSLALSLIGIIALWMGMLKIAEASGLIHTVVRFTQPILRPLFPEIPKDHPALGMIVLNLTANMLGLGNAATPLGIKAMEELQTLNPDPDTATNSMVMLLAMNTASVQLVPPVLLVALMGLQINQLIFAIIIVTTISLVVAVISARLLSRMKRFRVSNPVSQNNTGG
ncbi:MAG TPA: nucleoside recognition protein [Bacteroidetes bacterium]|nr:nucleoside recognition protein [Bacteroidota bacterium]